MGDESAYHSGWNWMTPVGVRVEEDAYLVLNRKRKNYTHIIHELAHYLQHRDYNKNWKKGSEKERWHGPRHRTCVLRIIKFLAPELKKELDRNKELARAISEL